MHKRIQEVRESWSHCKELLKTNTTLELFVAFLEDFKEQFTQLHTYIKRSGKTAYQKVSLALVDKVFVFWKQDGELSQLIAYVKKNWHKKELLLKRMDSLDTVISKVVSYYAKHISVV